VVKRHGCRLVAREPIPAKEGIMARKTCSACGRSRSLEKFPEDPRHADGRASRCRDCAVEATRAWREKNRKAHREYHREYMRRKRGAT